MPKVFLNQADISPGFKEMRCISVSQRMGRNSLLDLRNRGAAFDNAWHRPWREMSANPTILTCEQIIFSVGSLRQLAEQRSIALGQQDDSVNGALAVNDLDVIAIKVDVAPPAAGPLR